MTSVELAWLAGLLEGEGCFYFNATVYIKLAMTDEDVVARAAALMDTRYSKLKRPTVSGKAVYSVETCGQRAIDLALRLKPLMGKRRSQKIDSVLESAAKRPGQATGDRTGRAVCSNEMVVLLRREFLSDPNCHKRAEMSRKYGINPRTLHGIISGSTYKYVPMPSDVHSL